MELDDDLQAIEAQSFQRAYFSDGLLDILLGSFLLIWAIVSFFDYAGFGGVSFALLMPIYLVLRKRFTEPRVGVVKFRPQRRRQQSTKLALMAGVLALSLVAAVVLYLTKTQAGIGPSATEVRLAPLPLGLMFGLMLGVAGFMYDVSRAFIYTLWIVLSFVVTVFVNHLLTFDDLAFALGLSSLLPLTFGVFLLHKFSRAYHRA